MQIVINEYTEDKKNILIELLSTGRWPFHSTPKISEEKVTNQLQNGYFNGEGKRTFLINNENNVIGVIRLFDLGTGPDDSETPLFDIKIKEEFRGKGVGKEALKWLTELVFTNFGRKNRFEATTRADNVAMRRVFEKCGFVKEAHYRDAWPDEFGKLYDCTGYAILRKDWQSGRKTEVKWDT